MQRRTNDAFASAEAHRASGYACSACGYGIRVAVPPARCPMCGLDTIWEPIGTQSIARSGHVRLHLSDESLGDELCRYLIAQGFPTIRLSPGVLETLFPGEQASFAPAVELDVWASRHPHATVTLLPKVSAL